LGNRVSGLNAEAQAVETDFAQKQKNIQKLLDTAKNADRFIAETLANLRKIAARLRPDSPDMQSLEKAESFARKRAAETASSPDPANQQFASQYNNRAEQIRSLQERAQDLATRLSAEIDRFERMKQQIQYAYELRQLDKFISDVSQELDNVERVLSSAKDMNDLAKKIDRPAVPTQ
jgi:chromosome segregation ATPase